MYVKLNYCIYIYVFLYYNIHPICSMDYSILHVVQW